MATKINDMPRGWISESKQNEKIYYAWKAMHERSTEKYWEKYPTYAGTTVSDEWKYLSNFVNDIINLEGYDKWIVAEKNEMMLDKDTIVNGNKHYSKETCRFISHAESNRDVFNRHPDNLKKAKETFVDNSSMPVRFINVKTNETLDFKSLKDGCRELDLNFFNAWAVVSEKYPDRHTIKGWKIIKI